MRFGIVAAVFKLSLSSLPAATAAIISQISAFDCHLPGIFELPKTHPISAAEFQALCVSLSGMSLRPSSRESRLKSSNALPGPKKNVRFVQDPTDPKMDLCEYREFAVRRLQPTPKSGCSPHIRGLSYVTKEPGGRMFLKKELGNFLPSQPAGMHRARCKGLIESGVCTRCDRSPFALNPSYHDPHPGAPIVDGQPYFT
ncbi:uncharacterized protein L3040_006414 [Drepanopeziza brunnea f. sp. 'multigermtubi']|uniref:uncharacterized protein n=1 Tax=Drepanopeziza brunnea f. sp. 'multigermtubi' TaxID=698441 RepID=UPI002398182C|nr:hypothetical protein L3040_006414 [Drepanopeziza brunnea f. sp. 'multigermtubi']